MKIKIGDLTLRQYYFICGSHDKYLGCKTCPLNKDGICLAHSWHKDKEVDIPEELLK